MPKSRPPSESPGLIQALRASSLFSKLPEKDLREVAAFSRTVRLGKGGYLFRKNDPASGFFIVRSGIINVHRIAADGREQVIHLFRAGESFAEAAIAGNTGYPADARAVTASELILVPKDAMQQTIRKHPDFALRMLASMSIHLHALVNSLDDLKLKDVETRLLNWLVQRCPRPLGNNPVTLEIGTTKKVLAAELGTSSETLSRTFAGLRGKKLLTIRGSTVEIPKPAALQNLVRSHFPQGIP